MILWLEYLHLLFTELSTVKEMLKCLKFKLDFSVVILQKSPWNVKMQPSSSLNAFPLWSSKNLNWRQFNVASHFVNVIFWRLILFRPVSSWSVSDSWERKEDQNQHTLVKDYCWCRKPRIYWMAICQIVKWFIIN